MKEFKSIAALAKYYKISRMMVYRWRHNAVVLQWAEWLSKRNRLPGVLVARSNWEHIVWALADGAIAGVAQAATFCEGRAWDLSEEPTIDASGGIKLQVIHKERKKRTPAR